MSCRVRGEGGAGGIPWRGDTHSCSAALRAVSAALLAVGQLSARLLTAPDDGRTPQVPHGH